MESCCFIGPKEGRYIKARKTLNLEMESLAVLLILDLVSDLCYVLANTPEKCVLVLCRQKCSCPEVCQNKLLALF